MNSYDYIDTLQIIHLNKDYKTAKKLIDYCIEKFPLEEDSITLIIIDSLPDGIFKYKLQIYYYQQITNILFKNQNN